MGRFRRLKRWQAARDSRGENLVQPPFLVDCGVGLFAEVALALGVGVVVPS